MKIFKKIPFSNFTIHKFVNFFIIYFEMYILKSYKLRGKPYRMIIDSNNTCNLKCPLCPTGKGDKRRKRGYMTFDNFKKLIDENYKTLYSIDLYNWGEPFLHEDIFKMIKYAHDKNIRVNISSNLNHFNKDMAIGLVKSKLDYLIVSLDGVDQKTYAKYRVGGKIDNVFSNIKQIQEEKKKQNSKYPVIIWQFLVMKQNEHQIEKAKEISKELGVILDIKKIRPDMGEEIFREDSDSLDKTKDWMPDDDKFSIYNYSTKKRKNVAKLCRFLWTCPVINWNGSVSPCCSIYPENLDFGNVFDASLSKIWNNEKYQSARKIIGRGIKDKNITICNNCYNKGLLG